MADRVELGMKVRDRIHNIEGIVIARTEFLYGCNRIAVQPTVGEDGKTREPHWTDEPQVEVIEADNAFVDEGARFRLALVPAADGGEPVAAGRHGPRDDAQRAGDATR